MSTGISWTEETWNPTTGCDRISAGCDNCYALEMAKRLKAMGQAKYQADGNPRTSGPGFGIAVHPDLLDLPIRWRKPRMIFVNSMSDLFHEGVPDEFIARVFAVMALADWHTFQVLTKRHARMRALLSSDAFYRDYVQAYENFGADLASESSRWRDHMDTRWQAPWPLPNAWIGVSAEDQHWAAIRIHALLATPAAVRWVSAEPLLGPVDLRNLQIRNGVLIDALDGDVKTPSGEIYAACPGSVTWVVAGGESGPGSRPTEIDWLRSLRDQCAGDGTPFFFKQLGHPLARELGVPGKGEEWDDLPAEFRIRQFPRAAEAVPA